MAKRYIIQKREIKERHGKKPQLMGPYRTVYSDYKPPFDLDNRDTIESRLLRIYGEGRYQVKSVGKGEGEKKSTIKVHFSGDIERYRPRSKTWTKEERLESIRSKYSQPKEKAFVLAAFFILFIVGFWLFLAALGSGLDSSLVVLSVIFLLVILILGIFFSDMHFFETE